MSEEEYDPIQELRDTLLKERVKTAILDEIDGISKPLVEVFKLDQSLGARAVRYRLADSAELRQVLKTLILRHMSEPLPRLVSEILESVSRHLCFVDGTNAGTQYEHFVHDVCYSGFAESDPVDRVYIGRFPLTPNTILGTWYFRRISRSGVHLFWETQSAAEGPSIVGATVVDLSLGFTGESFSRAANQRMAERVGPFISAGVRAIDDVWRIQNQKRVLKPDIGSHIPIGELIGSSEPGKDGSQRLSTIVALMWSIPKKGDSLHRRMRNSLLLLAEADRQHHTLLRLALSMSALEALLSTKKNGIADELGRKVATLLESDPLERQDVLKRVKKLYDTRSDVLHGTVVDSEAKKNAELTRVIVSCVLECVMYWLEYRERLGGVKSDSQEYFTELDQAVTSGKSHVGSPEFQFRRILDEV